VQNKKVTNGHFSKYKFSKNNSQNTISNLNTTGFPITFIIDILVISVKFYILYLRIKTINKKANKKIFSYWIWIISCFIFSTLGHAKVSLMPQVSDEKKIIIGDKNPFVNCTRVFRTKKFSCPFEISLKL
jgi:hypothetical protein